MRIAFYQGKLYVLLWFLWKKQDAKYPLNAVDQGLEMFKSVIKELDPNNTAISISEDWNL